MGKGFMALLAAQALALLALVTSGAWLPSLMSGGAPGSVVVGNGPQLRSFASLADVQAFLARSQQATRERRLMEEAPAEAAMEAADAAAPANAAPASETAARSADGITNNQTAGVDEGGIVKMRGRHLVVLRRGRLFTLDTQGGLRTVSTVNAFPPGGDSASAWYDEMLISGDMVIVIGFNYARQGTEINRFRISDDGQLSYRDTYTLRSNDYYSSENYASRLIGSELIVYAPLMLQSVEDIGKSLPALAAYDAQTQTLGDFAVIADPSNIYAPPITVDAPLAVDVAHSVTRCDLSAATLNCDATVVLGGWSRSFYVGPDAVYVWTESPAAMGGGGGGARVYRIPLQQGDPGVVAVSGMPTDQFSFREDAERETLHVLVGTGYGDAMWDSETGGGPMRLLSLPLDRFASGSGVAEPGLYRQLPPVRGWGLQNRFVGQHVLYSRQSQPEFDQRGIGRTNPSDVVIVPLDGGPVQTLVPGHGVSRIDMMGDDALVIGNGEGNDSNALNFSAITLGAQSAVADRYRFAAASEGESRSHAFFFRRDAGSEDGANGMLGLPIRRMTERTNGGDAAILYLRRQNRRLGDMGTLDSGAFGEANDNCLASCTDWYGNARPIFAGNRVFALMGYELVEGQVTQGRIRELRRLDFTPRGSQR
jgi:hypothetical protein